MAAPIDLATLKADLSISGSTYDAFLGRAIESTWAAIEQFCGQPLTSANVKDTFAMPKAVVLSRFPPGSISSVVVDGRQLGATEFSVTSAGLVRRLSNGQVIAWSANVVTVTYSAGFTAQTLPADLYRVVLSCVSDAYSDKAASQFMPGVAGAVKSATVEGVGSVELSQTAAFGYYVAGGQHALLGPWAHVLGNYRDPLPSAYLVKSEVVV